MYTIFDDLTKLDKSVQQKYAKDFSEDDKDLENLLLFLWRNGINTIACCAGHIERNDKPYIYIDVMKMKTNTLKQILKWHLYNYVDISNIMVRNQYNQKSINGNQKQVVKVALFFPFDAIRPFLSLQNKVEQILNNEEKHYKLTKQQNDFISDVINVTKLDMKKYENDNPFLDIIAIGIHDVWKNKFSITSREQFELKRLDVLAKIKTNNPIIISKHTYVIHNGKYMIMHGNGVIEVSKDYILNHNIPSYEDIKGKNLFDYTHKRFIKELENLNVLYIKSN